MFKIIALLLTVSVLGGNTTRLELPPELLELIEELHNTCITKSGITEDDHKAYDILTNKDPKMMCYMKCLMVDSRWMQPGGKIDYEYIADQPYPHKEVLMAAIDKCRVIEEGADLCEKSYNFNLCMRHADPVNWFFI